MAKPEQATNEDFRGAPSHALRAKFRTALEREAKHFKGQLAPEFEVMFANSKPSQLIVGGSSPNATNSPKFITTSFS